MKPKLALIILIIFLFAPGALAEADLSRRLAGRILLGVESSGRAYYLNPADGKKYYLGRPTDAFHVMRSLGLGVSEADFNKLPADKSLFTRLKGRIILRVQNAGQAYYLNPADGKKYYLGRPADAFDIMRRLALGISDYDLSQITSGAAVFPTKTPSSSQSPAPGGEAASQQSVLAVAAEAIRKNDAASAESFFTPEMKKGVEYTMENLSAESRLLLANLLSGASLESQTETEKIYSNQAYFSLGGYNVSLHFYVKKQADGSWLITNL